MADAAVEFLLDNLKLLLVENFQLISNVKTDVDGLINDLNMLKAFLEDAVEESRELESVKVLMTQIRKLTFEMEDAIDTYVYEAASYNAKSRFKKAFSTADHASSLRQVAAKAQIVKAAVEKVQNDKAYAVALQRSNHRGQSMAEKKPPIVEEQNVVGFDDKATDLIGRLNDKTVQDLQVISIIGMPGLGKTTLANKVYNDPRVVEPFSTRGWIYVSKAYKKKDLLLSILKSGNQAATNPEDEKSLVQQVRAYLTWKYLFVLDDVWEPKDWDDITEAFPNCKNGSRILLTSRIHSIGVHANLLNGVHADPPEKLYKLDFLTEDQSCELLQIKAFGQRQCPKELISLSKAIATKCHGLPLALVVIGGLLQTKDRRDQWEDVARSVNAFLVNDEQQQCLKMLDLSYDHLPPHLKACFLYFGVFPKEYEIPVWLLIRLWIAERFVLKIGDVSLEKRAEDHLDELAARNLVLAVKRSITGRIKTCRVHDVLRDLCLVKAKEESFLFEIKEDGGNSFSSVGTGDHRRLCIHSGVLKYISNKHPGRYVRSFLCFAKDQVNLTKETPVCVPENFKLLRVYHIQPIIFHRFPTEIQKLVHLTHVAFSGDFTTIPAAMSKLWNLQTLVAETTSRTTRTINIQAHILKMSQFRHLHTNKASQLNCLEAKKSDSPSNKSIQTLTTITPESCTDVVLGQTPCVKKLGIRGKLAALFERKEWSRFDNLTNLEELVTLKLFNDVFPHAPADHKLQFLPQWNKFPPNLERLTLADTFLDWKQMHMLGKLPNLEELKLKDNAFTGVTWEISDEGFKKLRALQIWKTNLEIWEAKADHFPILQYLFLKDCTNLVEIPSSLGNVITLRTIKLHKTSPGAAASARKIKKWRHDPSKSYPRLKVEVFPPDLGLQASSSGYCWKPFRRRYQNYTIFIVSCYCSGEHC